MLNARFLLFCDECGSRQDVGLESIEDDVTMAALQAATDIQTFPTNPGWTVTAADPGPGPMVVKCPLHGAE